MLFSLSCCPHCQFIFTLFLCKLTGSSLVHSNTSQEQGLAVCSCQEAAAIPSACPKVSAAVSQRKPWQFPPDLCCVCYISSWEMYVFSAAAFWKAGYWAEASSSLLYIFVLPQSNICLKSSYYFFASFFLAYALPRRMIPSPEWKLCLGTPFKTWILPCLSLSKGMLLPSLRTLLTIASLHTFQANVKFPPFPKASLSTYSCLLLPWYSGETLTNSSLQSTFYACVAITKEVVFILTKKNQNVTCNLY